MVVARLRLHGRLQVRGVREPLPGYSPSSAPASFEVARELSHEVERGSATSQSAGGIRTPALPDPIGTRADVLPAFDEQGSSNCREAVKAFRLTLDGCGMRSFVHRPWEDGKVSD